MVDADRCELDEAELAQRVAEHLRPLDPRALTDVPRGNFDALANRADAMRARAPFAPRLPHAATPREQRLRHYLASFGVEVPPRVDGERDKADLQLSGIFDKILQDKKKRPSVVHVWAPAPGPESHLDRGVRRLRAGHVDVRWTMPVFEPSLTERPRDGVEDAVLEAVRLRIRATQSRAERTLRGLGVRARPVHSMIHQHVPSTPASTSSSGSSGSNTPKAESDRRESESGERR
jgi:hypothetical protein